MDFEAQCTSTYTSFGIWNNENAQSCLTVTRQDKTYLILGHAYFDLLNFKRHTLHHNIIVICLFKPCCTYIEYKN